MRKEAGVWGGIPSLRQAPLSFFRSSLQLTKRVGRVVQVGELARVTVL